MSDIVITGIDQLGKMLEMVSPRLAKNALAGGMRLAANLIKDQAKANFNNGVGPSDLRGVLSASIRTVQRSSKPDRAVFNVVAGKLTAKQKDKYGADSAYYALWVEKGHINRKMHDALFGTRRFKAYQREVSESNTPAHPFMAPAFQSKSLEALDLIAKTTSDRFKAAIEGAAYLDARGIGHE